MPTFGDDIRKTEQFEQNNGRTVILSKDEPFTFYPLTYLTSAGEEPTNKDLLVASDSTLHTEAMVNRIDVWVDKGFCKRYNDTKAEADDYLFRLYKFEVNDDSWRVNKSETHIESLTKDQRIDPLAWLSYEYYTNPDMKDYIDRELTGVAGNIAYEGKVFSPDKYIIWWVVDESGAFRFIEIKKFFYDKMMRSYIKNGNDPKNFFGQKHQISFDGNGLDKQYYLTNIDSGEGFEIDTTNLVEPNQYNAYGLAPNNIKDRFRSVKNLLRKHPDGLDVLPTDEVKFFWLQELSEDS